MRRLLTLTGAAVLTAVTVAAAATPAAVAAPAAPSGAGSTASAAARPSSGAFVRVGPVRALDTRVTGGALAPGESRVLDLSSRVTSATATAVVLNLTVTAPTAAGYLTVFPIDAARPVASSINKRAGETRSNSVTVALPANGSRVVAIYNQAGSTQVVVDVAGYYDPQKIFSGGSAYFPATPFRADDSRESTSGLDAGDTYEIVLPKPAGLSNVAAVATNVTAVEPNGPGYLTLWDGVGGIPTVSTVNYGSDRVTPNFAIVPVRQDSEGLHLRVRNSVSILRGAVVDISGYYATVAAGGTLYVPNPPARFLDTRTAGGPLGQGDTTTVNVTDSSAQVRALNINLTAVDATTLTYVTAFRQGAPRPFVSTMNPSSPAAVANAAQVEVSYAASVSRFALYNQAGSVNLVGDLQGYFLTVAT